MIFGVIALLAVILGGMTWRVFFYTPAPGEGQPSQTGIAIQKKEIEDRDAEAAAAAPVRDDQNSNAKPAQNLQMSP